MCVCLAGPSILFDLVAMGLELPLLVFAVMRWRPPPRPGVAASLIAATSATMVASMVTIVIARDASRIHGALTTLALAGAALVVIAHAIAPRRRPRDDAPLAVARAIETHGRRR
jgi:hypothetical protein